MSAVARLLPPPALRRDWVLAGFCAGGSLGVAEATWMLADPGTEAPPELRLLLTGASALLVVVLTAALGCWLGARRRPYSVLAGGVVGPLLAAPVVGAALGLTAGGNLDGEAALRLGAGLLLAVGVGWLAVRLITRLERDAGIAFSPLPSALGLAFVIAGAEWSLSVEPSIDPNRAVVLGALLLGGLAWLGSLGVLRRGRPANLGGVALGLLAALPLLAWGGRLWPWMLVELDAARRVERSNVLMLVVSSPSPDAEPVIGARELLARGATRFEGPVQASGLGPLLALSDGTPLLRRLAERGYRTAAFVPASSQADLLGAETLVVEPEEVWGAREVAWVAGGGVLVAIVDWRARDLGSLLARVAASPGRTSSEASAWLARWSAGRAAAPFALLAAYAPDPLPAELERANREVDSWIDRLEKLTLFDATCVAVVLLGPAPEVFDALLWNPRASSQPGEPAPPATRSLAETLLEDCAEKAQTE